MTAEYYQEMPRWQQLLFLILLIFGGAIVGLAVSLGIIALLYGRAMAWDVMTTTHTDAPGFLNAFRIFLGLGNTFFVFLAPAFVFASYIVAEPDAYLKARNYTPALLFLLVLLFMVFFLPTIDITSYWNQQLQLPPSAKGLDTWIHDTEKQAGDTMKILVAMPTAADLIITLFLVAVLPAISEEFFFRGCMQTILKRWTGNTHAAVWITAFIFSFIHFEFLGFVPRMLLGAGLGYLCAWSGSIWPSVFAHFLNNGWAVMVMYLYQHKMITTDPDSTAPMFSHGWIYVLTLLASIFVLFIYRQYTLKLQLTDGEELDQDL